MGCSASRPNTFLNKNNNPEESFNLYYASHYSPSFSHLETSIGSSQYSSPLTASRALSLQAPLIHHPPSRKGDSHHLVSLTSTTYGSLRLMEPDTIPIVNKQETPDQHKAPSNSTKNKFKAQVLEIMSESLSPDSVINTWELMDGLDDDEDGLDFKMGNSLEPRSSLYSRSLEVSPQPSSFELPGVDGYVKKLFESGDTAKVGHLAVENSVSLSKPLWKHLSEESFLSNLDPNVVSSYRRALSSRQLGSDKEFRNARSVGSSPMNSLSNNNGCFLHGTEDRVVLYFTSLRGIRKTYEDCYSVRIIFRGFRVPVDERDISMDSTYRKELQNVLKGKAMSLPQVFIRGKYVGSVEEIKQLNECGELAGLLKGFPVRDPKWVCDSCGDARFLPCSYCNGSRKLFDEEKDQLKRCPDCNENGLIRCPSCCS
ncbi:hypothetical protein K2173_018048 [Erythroxylum novogranatense]|uniref:Glutaredoxin domain-containing protein n=1 Tax=Erythroxylum novogranatense TaxID=1862640 RepID=A0AAV8TU68_9ROSI|nr:hypothetical protein K2173_018048 [Erythroxylum novogranatense]